MKALDGLTESAIDSLGLGSALCADIGVTTVRDRKRDGMGGGQRGRAGTRREE